MSLNVENSLAKSQSVKIMKN